MKAMKTKLAVLVLALSLMVCGVLAITAGAESSSDPTVSIYKKNVSFTDNPSLIFAVDYENCNKADLTMTVVNAADSTDSYTVKSGFDVTISGETYAGFALEGVNPKDIAEEVLVYVTVDDTEIRSEVVRYSIIQFALEGMLDASDAKEYARYESIVTYAQSVQEWLSPDKFSGNFAKEYLYLDVTDAKDLASGIYVDSKEVTLKYDTTALSDEAITGWMLTTNDGGVKSSTIVADGATVTITESTKIAPVFAPTETFDSGFGPYVTDVSGQTTVEAGEIVMLANNNNRGFITVNYMNEAAYATSIFEGDIFFDFDYALDSDVGTEDILYVYFKDSGDGTIGQFSIAKGDTDGTVKISLPNADGSAAGTTSYMTAALTNGYFKLRMEYYHQNTYSAVKYYVNGALAGIRKINSASALAAVIFSSSTNSEFKAKFDNFSFYKSDKAYEEEPFGLYYNFDESVPSYTTSIGSGGTMDVQTVTGPDGKDTDALVLNKTASGNDEVSFTLVRGANTTAVFQTDMRYDYTGGETHLHVYFGTAATTGDYAYHLDIYFSDGKLTMFDRNDNNGTDEKGTTVTLSDVTIGSWFNFRIEYTQISDTEILAVVYVNGEIVYVSDNTFTSVNNYGTLTWPIFGGSGTHITDNNNVWGTVSLLKFRTNSSNKGKIYFDNVFAQSIPTPDYNFKEEDYTSRFNAPAAE